MNELLGLPKLSGLTAVTGTAGQATELARIPLGAIRPAHLCVKNESTTANVYLKTCVLNEGGKVSATDHGVWLEPGESYDWQGSPPRGAAILAFSSVDGSLVSVEGNWSVDEDYR